MKQLTVSIVVPENKYIYIFGLIILNVKKQHTYEKCYFIKRIILGNLVGALSELLLPQYLELGTSVEKECCL